MRAYLGRVLQQQKDGLEEEVPGGGGDFLENLAEEVEARDDARRVRLGQLRILHRVAVLVDEFL